jgi:outer membrane PBP1 activator LpoA protein
VLRDNRSEAGWLSRQAHKWLALGWLILASVGITVSAYAFDLLAPAIPLLLEAEPADDYCSAEFRRLLIFSAGQSHRHALEQRADALRQLDTWLELIKQLEQRPCDSADLQRRVHALLSRRPEHPARVFFPGLFAVGNEPLNIALLLPASGSFAPFSRLLQQGAHEALAQAGFSARSYDTSQGQLPQAYRAALEDGASCLIGPLEKDSVRQLVELRPRVPVLALNDLPAEIGAPTNVLQMALAPEDQALALVDMLDLAGFDSGVILSAKGISWAQRIAQVLRESWESRGGTILESIEYQPGSTDFTHEIQRLLALDDSLARYRRLRDRLARELEFVPRRRADIEFIVVLADFYHGRMIYPQLRFWRATGLPVYASAQILGDRPLQPTEHDLDGLRLVLPTWLLDEHPRENSHSAQAAFFLGYSAAQFVVGHDCLRSRAGVGGDAMDSATAWVFDPRSNRFHYRSIAARIANGRILPTAMEK